jgi:hypothetical protein
VFRNRWSSFQFFVWKEAPLFEKKRIYMGLRLLIVIYYNKIEPNDLYGSMFFSRKCFHAHAAKSFQAYII